MASLWQDARAQQQYALQTLPQHLRQAAHDHAMHASNTSDDDDSSSGGESESSESDAGSNQLDACESLGASTASVMRRKVLLAQQQEQRAAAAVRQRRRVREVAAAIVADSNTFATVDHDGDEQLHEGARATHLIRHHQQPPPLRHALERKNSASKYYCLGCVSAGCV